MQITTEKGTALPLGSSRVDQGINFAIYAKNAKKIQLFIFNPQTLTILFETEILNKTGSIWHILVKNLPECFAYGYKINDCKLLIDPYAKKILSQYPWDHNQSYTPYSLFQETSFDWGEDQHPNIPEKDLIIYEAHVRGFTQDKSSKVKYPGTYLGFIEKIPHLRHLGINAVEFMPIFEFNENEITFINPETNQPLINYWGYSPLHFFSPMNRYSSSEQLGSSSTEFKTLVKELHRNGIEVILDVVFNHTGEGNEKGPTYSFKGIEEETYYILDEQKKHTNYTGCGNTFNTNHPITKQLIIECLRHWVLEYHVDGFRFDLASALTRGRDGALMSLPLLIEEISQDPILAGIKMIAEPWDASGLYQVGHFYPHEPRWMEWNGKYRDVVRRFMKSTPGYKGSFATCLCGSQDLYYQRGPQTSQNFITVHDGFTLHDLVSYNTKHNLMNGENNQDGTSFNDSWNCGIEGHTFNHKILSLRNRQMRNFHLALMVSQGVPILLMGDEYQHTKHGNNNTWCHDDYLNAFQWNQLKKNKDFFRFYSSLIHFRKNHPLLKRNTFLKDDDIYWHGVNPIYPDWDKDDHFLAFTLLDHEKNHHLYIAFNAFHQSTIITFPNPPKGKKWRWIVNTANHSPDDYYEENKAPIVTNLHYSMPPHSSLLLKAKE